MSITKSLMPVSSEEISDQYVDLSVVIPSLHEAENLAHLLPSIQSLLDSLGIVHEIIIVDKSIDHATTDVARLHGVTVLIQEKPGYGGALLCGFAQAKGNFILTLDADLSHPPSYIQQLWKHRDDAELIIASRYIPQARNRMLVIRAILSRILNIFFSRGLALQVRDMSSGYRLYKSKLLKGLDLINSDFSILQEALVKAYCEGWRILELPFNYEPRRHGSSHARVLEFGISYLRTFWSLYRLRNSILSADYDDRAYHSLVPPQRYWQRQRFKHITDLIQTEGSVLDVGCGSSRIIEELPSGSVAIDILMRKLRYARKFGTFLVNASGFYLPISDASFPCVLCSQVIEHVPKDSPILSELMRVLAPGGALILGTPDYANWEWRFIESVYGRVLPSAYADEHISHYTRQELIDFFQHHEYRLEAERYILHGELILKFRKPPK